MIDASITSALASVCVAVITGGVTLAGIKIQNSKRDAIREERDTAKWQRLEDRLVGMEGKLDEHNGYAQKFADSTVALARIDERLKNLEGRK